MTRALDIILLVAGLGLVAATVFSAVRYTMLPRAVQVSISREVSLGLRLVFQLLSARSPTYERRDRIMAIFGPVFLLTLLGTWLLMLLTAFTAIFVGLGVRPLSSAIELSGSSIFTLGTAIPHGLSRSIATYAEAGLGLLLLTLLITYLPTIYGAFSKREAVVTLLEVRAGSPPSAVEMLIRFHRIGQVDRLAGLWRRWEQWFVELEETHTSFPVLVFFRSPQPDHSWVTAAGTVLDAASLWLAAVEHPADPDANLMIRAGMLALRRIAIQFRVPYHPDPQPGDPVTISRYEFDEAWHTLASAGVPLKEDRQAAWESYAGWRVNYDVVLLNLARLTESPPAPWVSDRSPLEATHTWTLRRALTAPPTTRSRWSLRRGARG